VETGDPFRYGRLSGSNIIRLLELQAASSDDDPLRCRFVNVHLSQHPQYDIVTFSDNDYESDSCTVVSLEEQTIYLPAGLCDCLRRLRLETTSRFLWIRA